MPARRTHLDAFVSLEMALEIYAKDNPGQSAPELRPDEVLSLELSFARLLPSPSIPTPQWSAHGGDGARWRTKAELVLRSMLDGHAWTALV